MGLGRVCRWLLVAQCLRESSAVSVSRSVPVVWSAGSAWCDVTAAINEVLPALPCAVAHLSVPAGSEEGVALIDPRILALGSASVVAPGALNQRRLSLAVEDGMPLLPPAARVVVFRVASPASGTGELHLEVECAASLVVGPPGLGAHAEFARAVLRAALADAGISPEAVAELEEQVTHRVSCPFLPPILPPISLTAPCLALFSQHLTSHTACFSPLSSQTAHLSHSTLFFLHLSLPTSL